MGQVDSPRRGFINIASRGGLLLFIAILAGRQVYAQEGSLEQRQPLELVYADSIVPQDRHEMMLTSGVWYLRSGGVHTGIFTQKMEWGISDSLQVAMTVDAVENSNSLGPTATGMGDLEVGARYTWAKVGTRFTHMAIAIDAGLPTGDPQRGLGEAAYGVSPSLLASQELRGGKVQLFSTTGLEFVVAHRHLDPSQDVPHDSVFSNNGVSLRARHGWVVGEFSANSDRWSGGKKTQETFTPSYVCRIARRAEILLGVPLGLTSSTDHLGGVLKFTFELGGGAE